MLMFDSERLDAPRYSATLILGYGKVVNQISKDLIPYAEQRPDTYNYNLPTDNDVTGEYVQLSALELWFFDRD